MAVNVDNMWDENTSTFVHCALTENLKVERIARAASAADVRIADEYPSPETLERWTCLFGYASIEAVTLIAAQRGDGMRQLSTTCDLNVSFDLLPTYLITRSRIADSHWALIDDAEEAAGYDREAYEHRQQLPELFKSSGTTILVQGAEGGVMFGFRIGGLLKGAGKVKEVGGMEELPKVEDGWSEMGPVKFCIVDMRTKAQLEEWLKQHVVLKQ
ncbi:hypothetical protein PMIN06_012873 [Paraphaeosphaeria minitans]|uniref:Uncharacterized protein n=1 Tax=Paraphaeosphaeria minitans TaxID=565426 RepID=A0A9P6G8U6_9PLEO|nr:hypothetical protein PMIN01_10254 [Paraphaeosphaeria minitans]